MVNNDRIVPIVKIDLLSLIATVLNLIGTSFQVLAPETIDGSFKVTGTGSVGNFLANQPVKDLDFASGVTAGTVYFIPDYYFSGIKVAGAAATIDDSGLALNKIEKNGANLYKAALGSGEVTITAVTPGEPA